MIRLSRLLEGPHRPCNNLVLKRYRQRDQVKKWYRILGVPEDCQDEDLRLAFVHLAKKFHPDSGADQADALRFSEIEAAYRQIRKHRMEQREAEERSGVDEFDIKHTAPQHRHYLAYDVGVGTPTKRQRMYTIQRAQTAAENVMEHRLKKLQAEERNTLVGMDKQRARDIKTRYGMDRLVEDLIQEAMNRGEFSDLAGMGKPLKQNAGIRNPYVDFVTHKLNEVLIENGFTPEWIQLSKEIREETEDLKRQLTKARNRIGPEPLSQSDRTSWQRVLEDLKVNAKRINSKIDKYNLLVPIIHNQMLHVNLRKLADEALAIRPPESNVETQTSKRHVEDTAQQNFFDLIFSILTKKSI